MKMKLALLTVIQLYYRAEEVTTEIKQTRKDNESHFDVCIIPVILELSKVESLSEVHSLCCVALGRNQKCFISFRKCWEKVRKIILTFALTIKMYILFAHAINVSTES